MTAASSAPIRAAGGVVLRPGGTGTELLVIHRRRYDDWTLPKGKLEEDESWREGALREVREETGYAVEIERFAGATAYEVKGDPKVVVYFRMHCVRSERAALDASEVATATWLDPAEAMKKLSYPLERALLEVALATDPP